MTTRLLLAAALATLVAVPLAPDAWAEETPATAGATTARYQCPMHPQIVSSAPGKCPICGMELNRIDESAVPDVPAGGGRGRIVFYRNPMRADVTSPVPMKDEMGMDYVPVYETDLAAERSDVPGHAPFTVSSERQQLIGVKTGLVTRRPLAVDIRTVGKVAYDPTLYQAVVEYREAVRARREIGDAASREARAGADALVRSAALRLRQQGLSEAQLGPLAKDGRDPVNLLLPGDSVWVYAQVYEYELELVQPGQELTVTAPALPGREFRATVAAVDPIVDPATRTARVRALVATPGASLRPQSFVHVTIHVPLGERVAIPASAILDTGTHQIAFVVRGAGRFEPRNVRLGRKAGDDYELLGGVEPGEQVVTSANFLIDSESRFRSALDQIGATPSGHGPGQVH